MNVDQNVRRVIGAIDVLHTSRKVIGWALVVQEDNKWVDDSTLDFFVTVDGLPVEITIFRHNRGDLSQAPNNRAGFSIEINHELSPLDWVNEQRILIHAYYNGTSTPIGRSKFFHEAIFQQYFIDFMRDANDAVINRFFNQVTKDGNLKGPIADILKTVSSQLGQAENATKDDLTGSPVYLPAGMQALDKFAVLGEAGHIFLTGGTNNVRDLYSDKKESDELSHAAKKWIEAFKKRADIFSKLKATYIQLILPEKISVFPELFPEKMTTPSVPLRLVENGIFREKSLSESYINCLDIFRNNDFRVDLYHRSDTHLSEKGSFLLFCHIVSKLGLPYPSAPILEEDKNRFWVGDLSQRFFGVPLLNRGVNVSGPEIDQLSAALKLREKFDPANGGHIGKKRIWFNEAAPIKKRLAVFGNSFFECGDAPRHLSWWFARYFREFHFYWQPSVDFDCVEKNNYDIVICQTIERFLTRPPES